MSELIKVSDYAVLKGVSERTVRNWVKRKKLKSTMDIVNNKEIMMIVVDNDTELTEIQTEKITESVSVDSESISEAEVIEPQHGYSLVSMEKDSFDNLIESIKKMSDDRANTNEETIKQYLAEIHRLTAELKEIQTENKQHLLEATEKEIEGRVQKIRIEELEEKQAELKNKLEEKNKKIADLESQLNGSVWFKKL